jgi:hypothetical protein
MYGFAYMILACYICSLNDTIGFPGMVKGYFTCIYVQALYITSFLSTGFKECSKVEGLRNYPSTWSRGRRHKYTDACTLCVFEVLE